MFWFWLNMPSAAVSFAAWSVMPLWMILKHPNSGPEPVDSHSDKAAEPEPVFVLERD